MIWAWLQLAGAVILMTVAANRFIVASAAIARHYRWPPLVVGVLLVGFGTSFPELVVSLMAALKSHASLSVGNVIGSNVANFALVLGVIGLVAPITIHRSLKGRNMAILFIVTLIVGLLLWIGYLGPWQGVILIALLAFYLFTAFNQSYVAHEVEELLEHKMKRWQAWGLWAIALIVIFLSSNWLVEAAVQIANGFNISAWTIGLTVVAIGTTLPELAVSIISALKGEHDIAFGNVIGSNVFNLLAVLAMPAFFSPSTLPPTLFTRDYPWMLGFTVVVWLMMLGKKAVISRSKAAILLGAYLVYLIVLLRAGQ